MFYGVSEILNKISPFVIPSIMIGLGIIVGVICTGLTVKLIRRQRKLHFSIELVKLKSTKHHYFVFTGILFLLVLFVILIMCDGPSLQVKLMKDRMNMDRWQTNLTLSFLLVILLSAGVLFGTLAVSKCAVVDGGIYINMNFINWYHVHDYIIDETKGIVILSSSKDTFSTLYGTTLPLKVAKNDIAKLKFILNKNKNKFSKFSSDSYNSNT